MYRIKNPVQSSSFMCKARPVIYSDICFQLKKVFISICRLEQNTAFPAIPPTITWNFKSCRIETLSASHSMYECVSPICKVNYTLCTDRRVKFLLEQAEVLLHLIYVYRAFELVTLLPVTGKLHLQYSFTLRV